MKRFFQFAFWILAIPFFSAGQDMRSNGRTGANPCVAAGDRCYVIGTQNGTFPDMGGHVPGEMGGIWAHPIKLLDGFWLRLRDEKSGDSSWLPAAADFINFPYGNRFVYPKALDRIGVQRFQFCPDGYPGVVIEYTFTNGSAETRELDLDFAAKTDLRPVWFSEENGIADGPDAVAWNEQRGAFIAKDSLHPWYAVWGSSAASNGHAAGGNVFVPETTRGSGVKASIREHLTLAPGGTRTVVFVVAGSNHSEGEATRVYDHLLGDYVALLQHKKAAYRALLARARITIPDKHLQTVYDWVRINTAWLTRTVPEIGTGVGAGLMEYPWWFGCDNTYGLQALLATGDTGIVKNTLRLLLRVSEKANGNGRIVHEVNTNGFVYNKGNTQETAHFIMCVASVYRYTGDLAFVKEMYGYVKKGLHWLLTDMDQNHDLFPEGYGIMEVSDLNAELIDVAVYTQQALAGAALLADAMGDREAGVEDDSLAGKLKQKINRDFWDSGRSSYCDFYGTTGQALSAVNGSLRQLARNGGGSGLGGGDRSGRDDGLGRAKAWYEVLRDTISRMPAHSQGWLLNQNWVITTPMETGIAPRERALTALDRIRRENCGPYGPYLSAVERKYMMTIATGVQAVSECRYGRIDSALWYVNRIASTFGRVLPGSISEMMPDGGCFVQEWTNYGVIVPLVRYIFGVQPDVRRHEILLAPHAPSGWPNMAIEDLPVGDRVISLSRQKIANGVKYIVTFSQKQGEWKVVFSPSYEAGSRIYVNGKLVAGRPVDIPLSAGKTEIVIAI